MQASDLSLRDVYRARRLIAPMVRRTPLVPSLALSERLGCAVHLKLETLQETDWTVQRMMNEHGLSEDQSRKALDELTRQGLFKKIKVANPSGAGARMIAYRPVEKKQG